MDAKRIRAAADNRADWLTHGRTYDEQRFSPLAAIDQGNVKDLELAWYFDLDTKRGQEATPLVVDGTMYVTSAWSKVFALDARTGKEKWRFDPQVAGDKAIDACCDVVNRGVAAWGRSVFVGTLDGRLIALDMRSGKPLWSVQTTDPKKRYTITGAPRVIKGKVIIGNGGGEMGVRGYVSAYDAITGKQVWRFYTVPGNPQDGFENPLTGARREDVARRVVEVRRRRHGLGFDGLRSAARHALHRRRQRQSLEPPHPLQRRGRQPVPVVDRRAEAGHRRVRLALPDARRPSRGTTRPRSTSCSRT